jgi:proton glutamate symport protein
MLLSGTTAVSAIEPLGTLWINAVRMPVSILIPSVLILAVGDSQGTSSAGRLGLVAFGVMIVLLSVFAVALTPLAPLLLRGLELDLTATAALRARASVEGSTVARFTLQDWLVNLVPSNPLRAAVDGALLPLVAFSVLYGLALARVREPLRAVHLDLIRSLAAAATTMIRWVLRVAPVGVAALGVSLGAHLGLEAVAAIVHYTAVAVLVLLVAMVAIYGILLALHQVPVPALIQALLPAQAIAFASRSSLAALPVLLESARGRLKLPEQVVGLVLPLGAAVFKLNSPITWPLGALFVARLYGVELGPPELAVIAVASVFLSLTTPGIPSGGFLVQAPLYLAVGLPPEGLGVLIALDLVIDLFKTTLNVTAYVAVAALVARLSGYRAERHSG